MKKYLWIVMAGLLCSSFSIIGCMADDVKKDSLVGADVPRLEDLKSPDSDIE